VNARSKAADRSCGITRGDHGATRSSRARGGTRRASTRAPATSAARSCATASRYGGYAIVADSDGQEATTDVGLEIVAGVEAAGGYDRTVITARFAAHGELRVDSATVLHVPHYFPGFADRYFTNDAFSTLTCGASRGFGVIELNGFLGAAEASALDALGH